MTSESYGNTSEAIGELADEYGIDKANFILFWKMRFPNQGTMYMRDWARRLHDGIARNYADRMTLPALEKCGLVDVQRV